MELNEYKDAFLTEAREYLAGLSNALLLLEKDPAQTEAVREIFRAAHTLKGMSATMGYEPMARLTHLMETVLEPVRSGTQTLHPRLVDALLVCLDQLEKWVQALGKADFIEEEGAQAVANLLKDAARGGGTAAPSVQTSAGPSEGLSLDESEREVLSQARMNGFQVLKVEVELAPTCAFKEVRAFMLLKAVHEKGEIVKAHPAPEEIEKGRFATGFSLLVVTDQAPEALKDVLGEVAEVSKVIVEPVGPEQEEALRKSASPSGEGTSGPSAPLQHAPSLSKGEEKSFILPTIRVHTSKLEKLMSLVQELVISKIRFEQVAATKSLVELSEPLSQLHHVTDELQDEIMKVRLMPVKQIFERFPRMVRDLARSLGKQVDLEMDGAEVEIDRTVIEEMSEPLVHLLRNAVDHGIEGPEERLGEGKDARGTIRLKAYRERAYVVLSVVDDGRGVDPEIVRRKSVEKGLVTAEEAGRLTDEEAVRLIALPGFSTIENANEISGRGVGVDVAKTKVERMGGTFRILSRKGQGTTFILRFPLTLAIIKALLVRCLTETFAIPIVNIIETVEVERSELRLVQQQETILLREEVIPVYRLRELLEMEAQGELPPGEESPLEAILIAEVGEARVGILVDAVLAQQEIAIKPLDRLLKGLRGFSGATILGNGKIALILDVNSLVEDLKDRRFQSEHAVKD